MDQHLLLAKEDYAAYADMPESLEMKRLTPHILAVQRARLRPLLTEKLYAELARLYKANELTEPYLTLLSKCVPVLATASLARYMPFAQSTITSNGIRMKNSQHSEATDGRDLARMASVYDGEALSYEVELKTWLLANAKSFGDFYPHNTCGCGTSTPGRTPSVVVQPIRRPTGCRR
ncbi:hypothetical protein MUN82_03870 [Hymenobacter aerilatus]|uniref:Uncharacterized protein n=1 Tax=Hymenobacter aerilatus TaxID=2932251 RepID=A0A8T9T2A6_9BACT|nr:hypothetical protein [Hymenobacter aerilatus]UOR06236.1 hypothetical protein MUN82_03870 [Hymenobacter aerilatus]